jgi:hypothetical protein
MRSSVNQALDDTVIYLSQPQESGLSNIQSKLCEFIRAAYRRLDNDKNKSRWQKLRDIDCSSFLLIGLSYTLLEIGEMCQAQFDYLIDTITKFQQAKTLPPKWFFVTEIQLAVAAEGRLLWATDFRRSMYISVCLREITDTNRILLSRIQSKQHRRKLGIGMVKKMREE